MKRSGNNAAALFHHYEAACPGIGIRRCAERRIIRITCAPWRSRSGCTPGRAPMGNAIISPCRILLRSPSLSVWNIRTGSPAGIYPNGFAQTGEETIRFLRPQEAERKEVCSPVFCPYGCGSYCQNGSGAPRGGGVRFWFWDSLFRGGVHRPGGTEAAGKREAGRWAAGRRRPAAGRPGLWRRRRQSQRPFLRIRTGPAFAASHA